MQFTHKLIVPKLARELLLPLVKDERRRHKLKRLVQHPNSYFMDVKVGVFNPLIGFFGITLAAGTLANKF